MTALAAIKYEPDWEGPEDDNELQSVAVDKKFQDRVDKYHVGLKQISLKAEWRDANGALLSQPVQVFRIKNAGKNKIPGITPDVLAQVIFHRAQEHAEATNEIITYRANFYGDSDELEGSFQKQGSFKIDGRRSEEEQPLREKHPEEDSRADEPEPDFDEVRHGRGVRVLPTSIIRHENPAESEAANMLRLATQAVAGILAEGRAALQQLRQEFTAASAGQRDDYRAFTITMTSFIDALRDELRGSRIEVSKANDRLIKLAEQYSAHADGQQEAMKQSWGAFQTGLQLTMKANESQMNWERQYMFMQFEQLAQKKDPEKSSWIKDLAPYAMAAVGQVLSAKGAPHGQLLQDIATEALKGNIGEDEDDDDDEDAPAPAAPTTVKKPVLGVPPGANVAEHYNKNPIASLLQLLNSQLTPQQKTKLQATVGNQAWTQLQTALKSPTDAGAKAYLIQFVVQVQQAGVADQLMDELTEEQKELFEDLTRQVIGNTPAFASVIPKTIPAKAVEKETKQVPVPPAKKKSAALDPGASVAQIRSYAKSRLGLTFPLRAKKEEMLKVIAEKEES